MDIFDIKYWERKIVDLWSIVHFNTGVVFAFVPFSLGVPFWQGFAILFLIASIWEYVEILKIPKEIRETTINKINDIVVALVGFSLVYLYMPTFQEQPLAFTLLVLGITLYASLLAYVAWNAMDRYSGGPV